ncbi:MAG: hypothetical protein BZY88_14675 [SAR202 cluster bacterium Io17-Chloro-G9]|nr:MAG: hypothetical protein BZY88_14675 [SAR202 cluster bacterium Io17-Chloro-G9]
MERQIQTFYQVNGFISSIDNLEELLNLVMRESEAAVDAEASCIALFDPADGQLHIEFASGEADAQVRHLSMPLGQGILGEVASIRYTVSIDDVHTDSRFDPTVDRSTGFVTRAVLATPIQRHKELLGVLQVINKRDGSSFTQDDARLLEIVANQAAIAIENSRLIERIVHSEQLSAVGKMAAAIVHDFKKPMSVIRGFAEMLNRPEVDSDRRIKFSGLILEDVDRFLDMTQELLDYSGGLANLQPKELQLGDWLDSLGEYLAEDCRVRNLKLITKFQFRGPARIDSERMRRAVINIAGNAADAMTDGGELTIASRRRGDYWQLSLKDTGSGIPPEIRARIFEPFVSSGKQNGTGLGLAVVKETVEVHGGRVRVESHVAGEIQGVPPGSEFLIAMPIAGP